MLLGKLCERKDKTALMYMHRPLAVLLFETRKIIYKTRMWANAQRDGRPAEYRWRPLFNAAKFG